MGITNKTDIKNVVKACIIRNKAIKALHNSKNKPNHIDALYNYCDQATATIKSLAHEGLARILCRQINDTFVRQSILINKKARLASLAKRSES